MDSSKLKKIAIVGPESTGKSELAKALARHFHKVSVPEVAREYLENLDRPYTPEDVEHIARLQLEAEDELAKTANGYLFCDTSLIVIKVWMTNSYGYCPQWILNSIKTRHYDLFLLTDIDLPWEPDPLREHPNERQFFLDWYRRELVEANRDYMIISGFGDERLSNAIAILEKDSFRI